MAHYIFNAIPTDETNELCQQLANSCRNTAVLTVLRNTYASGVGKGLLRSVGMGALKNVTANDHLYVLMHGTGYGGTSNVGVRRGAEKTWESGKVKWINGNLKKYSVEELARVLDTEGLTKQFVHLHLTTCGSGFTAAETSTAQPEDKTIPWSPDPLAKQLKAAMVARGFNAVTVTGYKGNVVTNVSRNNWFSVEKPDKSFVYAPQAAVTF
jgi:hypothetical protein